MLVYQNIFNCWYLYVQYTKIPNYLSSNNIGYISQMFINIQSNVY